MDHLISNGDMVMGHDGNPEMISGLHAEDTYQLYRDYLDNFRINHGGR